MRRQSPFTAIYYSVPVFLTNVFSFSVTFSNPLNIIWVIALLGVKWFKTNYFCAVFFLFWFVKPFFWKSAPVKMSPTPQKLPLEIWLFLNACTSQGKRKSCYLSDQSRSHIYVDKTKLCLGRSFQDIDVWIFY